MSAIVGFVGSHSRPSRTRSLAELAVRETARRTGVESIVFDLNDLGPTFGSARHLDELDDEARLATDRLRAARAIVVGCPVYKGSYPGLFKHLFDLLEPDALAGKPVLLCATGGGDKHALIIEHQLRPLFGFFEATTIATGVYASSADFVGEMPSTGALLNRLERAVEQLATAMTVPVAHGRLVQPAA